MIQDVGVMQVEAAATGGPESDVPTAETKRMSRSEKVRRWLVIIGSVILAIFLIYLLLILIYPSMNIGMNP